MCHWPCERLQPTTFFRVSQVPLEFSKFQMNGRKCRTSLQQDDERESWLQEAEFQATLKKQDSKQVLAKNVLQEIWCI